ncbi:hypothetical protein [Halorarum salinum]|uniref:Uncharacterized protein n=1 Tax=Halorarum salinum TaxID=2743089 RepID=A0A7D5LC87_9EURY|nr:hypothetical protein [Halobaculum salinum]QLG63190.1 hypothetical protein HUG12_16205 [Halobaculum salinum]
MDNEEYAVIEDMISKYEINLANELDFEEQMQDADKFWRQIRMHLHGLGLGYLWMLRKFNNLSEMIGEPNFSAKKIREGAAPTKEDHIEMMEIVDKQEERVRREWFR